jgi:hypothetical protein
MILIETQSQLGLPRRPRKKLPLDGTTKKTAKGLTMNYDLTSFSTFAGEVSSQVVEDFWSTFIA